LLPIFVVGFHFYLYILKWIYFDAPLGSSHRKCPSETTKVDQHRADKAKTLARLTDSERRINFARTPGARMTEMYCQTDSKGTRHVLFRTQRVNHLAEPGRKLGFSIALEKKLDVQINADRRCAQRRNARRRNWPQRAGRI
jgi:hypothetical protein